MSYDKKYFEKIDFDKWLPRNQAFFRSKQRKIISGFFDFSKKILDIGCGSTPLSKAVPELDVVGTDLHYSGKNVIRADAYKQPFKDNSIDQIYSWCLLEHLEQPEKALREMNRVLKKGGKIVLSTELPSKDFYRKDKTHIQPFTKEQLETMFEKAGFRALSMEKEIYYFKGITYLPFSVSYVVGRALDFLSRMIIVKAQKE